MKKAEVITWLISVFRFVLEFSKKICLNVILKTVTYVQVTDDIFLLWKTCYILQMQ